MDGKQDWTKEPVMAPEEENDGKSPKKERKGLFDRENPMNLVLGTLGSLILVNIYFIVCSLPIVTMGASLTALNRTCYALLEESDERITKLFFKTFAQNLLDATLVWIIGLGVVSFAGYQVYRILTQGAGTTAESIVMGLCGLVILAVLVLLTFYFALLFRYADPVWIQLRNAFLTGISNLGWTLVIWVTWGAVIALYVAVPGVWKAAGWIWLVIGFALMGYVTCRIYRRVFAKLEGKQ